MAGGVVVAVALPWALVRGMRGRARWAGWLLVGYPVALVGGMRYYLSVRFTPPSASPAVVPALSAQFVLEIAGLSAETLVFVAITLLILAVMAEIIAPGPVGGWVRAHRTRRPATPPPDQGAANTDEREA